jgi:lipase ATG15
VSQVLRDLYYHKFSTSDGPPHLHAASVSSKDATHPRFAAAIAGSSRLTIRSRPISISRRRDWVAELSQRKLGSHQTPEWVTVEVPGPNITDKTTVVNLAKMCSDAYILAPTQPDWLNTTLGFNHSDSFGWTGEGLRGHVFTDATNETVIVAFKGTTVGEKGHAPITTRDRS